MCCDENKSDNNLQNLNISIATSICDWAIFVKQFDNKYGKK